MSRRISARDRTWARFHTVRSAGPLDVPPADEVRRVLAEVARRDPGHPWLSRIEGQRLRPVPEAALPAFLDEVVRTADGAEVDADAEELARRAAAQPLGDLPFRLVLGRGAAAIRSAHMVGDGAVVDTWFPALLACSGRSDATAATLVRHDATRFPLLRAGLRHFAPHPLRAARALRAAFPLTPPAPDQSREVDTGVADLATVVVPQARVAQLRAWRDRSLPGVSVASVLMSEVSRALDRHGLLGDGVSVMMGCRRYLGQDAAVTGNFSAGPYLTVDPRDPAALGAAVAEATETGVPLVLLAAATARSAVLGRRTASGPRRAGVPPRPRVTLSYQGRLPLDGLPWTDRSRARYPIVAVPGAPDAVTVAFVHTPAGLQVSASAHPEVLDTAALRAALSELAAAGRPEMLADPAGAGEVWVTTDGVPSPAR